ncbi:MAG: DUF4252 domain-containing protein [Bacteroidales bacterium]|jgi:hypothetical protein|nr:DUF4252 domain-containing protein [Bacteroidales bacterium]
MKRIFGIILFSVIAATLSGQRSVDDLFENNSDDNGFINLTISGSLLKKLRSEDEGSNKKVWPNEVTSVRILIPEDEDSNRTNFMDFMKRDRDLRNYEEFMSVRQKDQDIKMLVRMDGRVIREFLLIGGGEDNFIMQVKGRITVDEAEEFSREARKDHRSLTISGL